MTRRQRRLALVLSSVGALSLAAVLVLFALSDSVTFFYSPTDIKEKNIAENLRINLGGLVEKGSVDKSEAGVLKFVVTDGAGRMSVRYQGVAPDLFREGQGVVATGKIQGGVFAASAVLAKHDENYMPPEVAKALKERGVWQHGDPAPHPNAAAAPDRPAP
jgi:cytochrome c-type biogenesis protein CcmE